MKKKILSIILIIIIVMIVSITTAYGASYLYNSNEVYYDNSESKITSSDVQGAIDQLYTEATNYSNYNNRLTNIENDYFTSSNAITKLRNKRTVLYSGDSTGYVPFNDDISKYEYFIVYYYYYTTGGWPIAFSSYFGECDALMNQKIILTSDNFGESNGVYVIFHGSAIYTLKSNKLELVSFIRDDKYHDSNQMHITEVVAYK